MGVIFAAIFHNDERSTMRWTLVLYQFRLWIIRLMKLIIFCCFGFGFIVALNHINEEYLTRTEPIALMQSVSESYRREHVFNSSIDTGEKANAKMQFEYSLEPDSETRRLPERFYKNLPRVRANKLDFAVIPRPGDCNTDVKLLILVKSSVMHFEQRNVIRNTWGSMKEVGDYEIRILYLLGKPRPSATKLANHLLANETSTFGDVIVGDFVDAYTNVTRKSLVGLKFVAKYCSNVEYILFVDDDVFVKIPEMISLHFPYLDGANSKTLHCGLQTANVARVTRRGKWAIEYEKYDRTFYPPYCMGACYLMSRHVAIETYNISLVTPSDIPVDDALLTGILREKIGVYLASMRRGLCTHLINSYNVSDKLLQAWNET